MSLSPIQIRAAQLLARGLSQEETGKQVGVSRRTISRWLCKEEFKNLSFGLVNSSSSSTKNEAEIQSTSQTNDESSCELSHLVPLAFMTLENILTDPDARKADKLKAATLIGQWGGLTTDFNVALTSLRRYGLVLYQSDDGGWTVKQLLAE
jgi:transcriptional regulator with XRE-family HTH domain